MFYNENKELRNCSFILKIFISLSEPGSINQNKVGKKFQKQEIITSI